MQFGFNVASIFGIDGSGIALFTDQSLKGLSANQQQKIETVLDGMGRRSQTAQGLSKPITTLAHIRDSHHFLFLAVDEDKCLGILKGGIKHLFMLDSQSETHEMDAMCCLDFYTHESVQRKGIGTHLFRAMELYTHISAQGWAFDRPSPKLIAFLAKVYDMIAFKPQMNNFLMEDAAIRLWGAEFKHYRRHKAHYVPDAYLLPEAHESTYMGKMDFNKRPPLPVSTDAAQQQSQSQAPEQQQLPTESTDAQKRPSNISSPLIADELLGRRSVVLPSVDAKKSLAGSDNQQSVAMAYSNKRIRGADTSFEEYMENHYGAKSIVIPPNMNLYGSRRSPGSQSKGSLGQEDMAQRQRKLDRMAYELAREANVRGSALFAAGSHFRSN